ncbi:MAG: hypothetical protein AUH33_05350 [Chloroflexi bacterium 13_1_40CM_68_21]|nr:MAG: hypothetical protein AUH33_05350 [Chloroflexi bacterium 13_1_40CM_68_21]
MTLRGSTSEFPLESVVGLLAGTSKTGELQIRGGGKVGALGFAGGRLVAAVMDNEGGEAALGAIFAVSEGEFEFTPWASAPEANLEAGDLVALLKRAAEARDRLAAIRQQIPDDHARFKLSEKAADSGAVTFTPDRWRALLAVNGERDVTAVAEQLRLGKMETLSLLAGLVRDGVIEIIAPRGPAEPPPAPAETRHITPAPEPAPPPAPVEAAAPPPPEPLVAPPPPEPERHATQPVQEWTPTVPEERPAEPPPAPPVQVRPDLQAELAERFMERPPREEVAPPPPAEPVPPAVDDRLASLTGIFAPGPAANAPPAPPPASTAESAPPAAPADPWGAPQPPPSPSSTASWMTPSPASTEAPSNAWAPTAPRQAPAASEPWSSGSARAPESPAAPAGPRGGEWTAPSAEAAAEKKRGGFLSRFRKEEPAAVVTRMPAASVASKGGLLASLSNALLVEYGSYGKGKIETRMANLLMRVDEQADPIDRPLPIVDDLIDATALEREGFAEEQSVPYLATLVRQIYEDAERAFGKDKAKKGYKAAQQQVFGNGSALSPDLAGKLPKV